EQSHKQLVGWRLGELVNSIYQVTKSPSHQLLLEFLNRDAAAALFRWRRGEAGHQGMLLEEPRQRAFQLARAVAVNHSNDALIGEERFVEKPFRPRDRLVDAAANHVQVRGSRLARLQLYVDADLRRRRGTAADDAQIAHAGPHPLAAGVEVGDHVVDFATGRSDLGFQLFVQPPAEGLLALAQRLLALPHPPFGFAQRLTLPRREPLLVFERAQVAVDLREVLGELRLSR